MANIQPYGGVDGSVASQWSAGRLARQTSRSMAQIDAGTRVQLARIESIAEVQAVKVGAVAYVGRSAMQDVAMLSQIETQLAQAVPHASGRLAGIADLTAIAMSEVVVDTARRIGR